MKIYWVAVTAASLAVFSLISSLFNDALSISSGLAAITVAVLSIRER